MNTETIDIKKDGLVIGRVLKFRAPSFTGRKFNYTPARSDGSPLGMAQPTMRAAEAIVRSMA